MARIIFIIFAKGHFSYSLIIVIIINIFINIITAKNKQHSCSR